MKKNSTVATKRKKILMRRSSRSEWIWAVDSPITAFWSKRAKCWSNKRWRRPSQGSSKYSVEYRAAEWLWKPEIIPLGLVDFWLSWGTK